MDATTGLILQSLIVLGGLGALLGALLVYASKVLAVEVDARVADVEAALPGLNCGICGHPGCFQLADAIVKGKDEINACKIGGLLTAEAVAEVMGLDFEGGPDPGRAYLLCQGGAGRVVERFEYAGAMDCHMAEALGGGPRACEYGCIGFGSCVPSCPLDLIHMDVNGLPVIDAERCTGCGECVRTCPRDVIELLPLGPQPLVACNSLARGKAVKDVCSVGCISCQKCVKICPTGAQHMDETKALASIDYALCINCGDCIGECPTKSIFSRRSQYIGDDQESEQGKAKGADDDGSAAA